MASSVIHMAVASEINKIIKRNGDKILIGSIAPDISKHIGQTKVKSHFLDEGSKIPNVNKFLDKYKNNLNDDFVMGYFIHLYTDYLWFKYFIPNFYKDDIITKIDGSLVKCDEETFSNYLYNDYTNLNIKLLDEYNMDLSIFYNEVPNFENIIDEIPMDKLSLIIDATGIIIENTKVKKYYIFDIECAKKFILFSTDVILEKINELLSL